MVNAEENNVVEFPLRGEWTAINTPAYRIPSHGTDMLGQRYAFDFIRISRKPLRYLSSKSVFYHALGHVSVKECFGWSQPVYSPCEGKSSPAAMAGRILLSSIASGIVLTCYFALPKLTAMISVPWQEIMSSFTRAFLCFTGTSPQRLGESHRRPARENRRSDRRSR